MYRVNSGIYRGNASPPDARDVIERIGDAPAFSYSHMFSVELSVEDNSKLVTLCELQGDAFKVLQWFPTLGRLLQPKDYLRGSDPVVVLSHRFWVSDFASRPDILGQSIRLNGKSFQVVGILPPEADRVSRTMKPAVWIPLVHSSRGWVYGNRNYEDQRIVVRIQEPNTLVSYQVELDRLTKYIRDTYPDTPSNLDLHAVPERDAARTESSAAAGQAYVLVGLVGVLLLTACFNMGNMFLVNAYRREREFAIRRSVGASMAQIARQLTGESMLVAFLGGLLGVLIAMWLVPIADQLPLTRWVDVQLNRYAIIAAVFAVLMTGLVSGIIPTLHLARGNIGNSATRGARGTHVSLTPRVLVVAQVAFSTVLLTTTLLYIMSIRSSMTFDLGYDPSKIVSFRVSLQSLDGDHRERVAQDLRDQLAALPGVESASFSAGRLLGGYGRTNVRTDRFMPEEEEDRCQSGFSYVSRGYLGTLGIPIVEGRDFLDSEAGWKRMRVALVNQAFAKRFYPDGDALGQELSQWGSGDDRARIVGIFGDFSGEPWQDPEPLILLAQSEPRTTMLVRAQGDPRSILGSVQSITRNPKNEYVTEEIHLFSDVQDQASSDERSVLYVLGILSISSLLLSSVGVWYTARQFVRQGRRELSIRLAIGALPRSLLLLILRRSLSLVVAGLGLGLLLSFVMSYWVQRLINGVSPLDLFPYVVTVVVLFSSAFVSTYFPARSAAKADPRESLNEV